mmetsp:Transcript_22800/g.20271  ORF Transcript_22800/g.20271 Transcript_22800/m.20271 type:complete len:98 (-) Transcript_22800:155-448(-)
MHKRLYSKIPKSKIFRIKLAGRKIVAKKKLIKKLDHKVDYKIFTKEKLINVSTIHINKSQEASFTSELPPAQINKSFDFRDFNSSQFLKINKSYTKS